MALYQSDNVKAGGGFSLALLYARHDRLDDKRSSKNIKATTIARMLFYYMNRIYSPMKHSSVK